MLSTPVAYKLQIRKSKKLPLHAAITGVAFFFVICEENLYKVVS